MDAAVLDALEIGCYDLGCFDTHSVLDAAVLDGTILDVVNTPYEGSFGCYLEVMNVGCSDFGCCVNWMLRSWMLLTPHNTLHSDAGSVCRKIRKFETDKFDTNGSLNPCNSCKRVGPSRLHELHGSKLRFVSRIKLIRPKFSNCSAHVSRVIAGLSAVDGRRRRAVPGSDDSPDRMTRGGGERSEETRYAVSRPPEGLRMTPRTRGCRGVADGGVGGGGGPDPRTFENRAVRPPQIRE